jgi:hypothetical protein
MNLVNNVVAKRTIIFLAVVFFLLGNLTGAAGNLSYGQEQISTGNPGYLPLDGKMRSGIVVKIDSGRIWLKLDSGQVEYFSPSPFTQATKNGRRADLGSLYEGDRVKLYFDRHDADEISRLEIQGDFVQVSNVYKGKLAIVRTFGNGLVLENVQVLKEGRWQNHRPIMPLTYADNLIYAGGRPVSQQQLGSYRGSEVYLVVKEFFGREQAERVIIKGQFETAFTDKIETINLYTENLKLQRNENVTLHDGTVIIKNGRLVDRYSLHSLADAFIVADGSGSNKLAQLIYVYNEDINNSSFGRNGIYSGKLDVVTEDRVWLEHINLLSNNRWQYQFDLMKELEYDHDTFIYDLVTGKQISPTEFSANNYAVDEWSEHAKANNLKSWYAYLFTNGDRIAGITVMRFPENWYQQRVTTGTIQTVTRSQSGQSADWTVTLQDVREWSNLREQWMIRDGGLTISITGAMLVRDGQAILPEELKQGDRVYLVRDDFRTKVLLVK